MHQAQGLQEISDSEVDPSQSSSYKLPLPQHPVQFPEVMLEPFHAFREGLVESKLGVVVAIDKADVSRVQILIDSLGSGEGNLLFRVSSIEFWFGLVAEIDADGIAFGDYLLPIDKVGQCDCWILLKQLRLDLIEPLGPSLWSCVSLLLVGHGQVLQQLPDPLPESPHVPVPQGHCWLFHKIFIITAQA